MKNYKSKQVIFDWVKINYPLVIAKLLLKKKILGNFCTIYKNYLSLFSQYRLWMFFKMYLCNAVIVKQSRRSSLAVYRKRDFMISSCSFTATNADLQCCKPRVMHKHVGFEHVDNWKWSAKGLRTQIDSIAWNSAPSNLQGAIES